MRPPGSASPALCSGPWCAHAILPFAISSLNALIRRQNEGNAPSFQTACSFRALFRPEQRPGRTPHRVRAFDLETTGRLEHDHHGPEPLRCRRPHRRAPDARPVRNADRDAFRRQRPRPRRLHGLLPATRRTRRHRGRQQGNHLAGLVRQRRGGARPPAPGVRRRHRRRPVNRRRAGLAAGRPPSRGRAGHGPAGPDLLAERPADPLVRPPVPHRLQQAHRQPGRLPRPASARRRSGTPAAGQRRPRRDRQHPPAGAHHPPARRRRRRPR